MRHRIGGEVDKIQEKTTYRQGEEDTTYKATIKSTRGKVTIRSEVDLTDTFSEGEELDVVFKEKNETLTGVE